MNSEKIFKSLFAVVAITSSGVVLGQAVEDDSPTTIAQPSIQMEETVVLGRLRSAAGDLVLERVDSENIMDVIGSEQIGRIGDSTVAVALTRVPGITLVDGQYVYVRGLGERYSSTELNGATVPSPDLTRNVLPLDIFPSSIIESIAIEKAYSADMSAGFGGGNIDIRTKGIPSEFVFSVELGTSYDSESTDILTYNGGSDDRWGEDDGTRALDPAIDSALRTYFESLDATEGSLSAIAIQATAERANAPITDAEAEAINAALGTLVYRDLDINEESNDFPANGSGSITLGNLYEVGDLSEIGFLTSVSYDSSVESVERIQRTYSDPEEEFQEETKSTASVAITATANVGWRFMDDHEITSTNIFLRNTDDDVSITNIYNSTSPFSSGQGSRNYDYRFEQRELTVNQLAGSHTFGYDTQSMLGLDWEFLEELEFNWFYSDSTATTDIPSETNILASITRDTATDEIVASTLTQGLRMVDVRYTELEDEVESTGYELKLPVYVGDWEMNFSGGAKFDRKSRVYDQLDLSIGSSSSDGASTLTGSITDALSDANLTNPDYDYDVTYQSGLSRSYIAASTTDAYYGQADFFYNYTWRATLGVRYEEYKQFSSPWRPYRINSSPLLFDPTETNASGNPDGVFYDESFYPSAAFTYSNAGFMGTQDFNVRFSVSETVVRPDLREVSDSSYLDPLLDIVVNGNTDAVPSDLTNYDARAEWFFDNGDNLTVSAFYKDIQNPLEYFQETGAEDSITASIENAESGESLGVELEWLKSMDFMGAFASQFFFSGNVTLADSEIQVGDDTLVSATNRVRPLRGASEYVVNLRLGYDSDDGKHAATIAYNVFGERLFAGGVGEQPDSYEQPFNSLDVSYSYYLGDNFTLKLKARNLLDESIVITQGDVDIYEEVVGQSMSFDVKYDF